MTFAEPIPTPADATAKPAFDPAKAHAGLSLKHDRQLIRAKFSPCGKFIAAAGLDGIIHVWELDTEKKFTLPGHDTWISALVFNPQGKQLFTADFHGAVHCWDYTAPDSKPLWTIARADANVTRTLAASPDGKLLASAGDDNVVRLWNTADGKPAKELPGHNGGIYSLAFHPDGKALASGDLFGVVKHWDVATGKCERELDAKILHTRKADFLADVGGARALAFDKSGATLAASGMKNAESNAFCPGTPCVVVFEWSSGKPKEELRGVPGSKADGPINGLRFLSDGTLAGYGEGQSGGTSLMFWRAGSAEPFHFINGESAYDLDTHPDGLRLVAPMFVSMGSGGNGARSQNKGRYIPNGALVRVFNLWPDANAGKKPAKKA